MAAHRTMIVAALVACSPLVAHGDAKPPRTPMQIAEDLAAERKPLPPENTGMTAVVQGLTDVTPKTRAAGRLTDSGKKTLSADSEFCETFKKR
mgnify:CR=1 FL=1